VAAAGVATMMQTPCELVPEPRGIWTRTLGLIGASYALDGVMLAAYAAADLIPGWVSPAYTGAGLGLCAVFYGLIASGFSERFRDSNLTLLQIGAATLLLLTFIVLVPSAALYFVCVLFIVFGFGSLRLRPLEAMVALGVVAVVLGAVFLRMPQALELPNGSSSVRLLVGAGVLLTLVRCTLLGLYSSELRRLLARRYAETREVLDASERQRAEARELHDDLGQELTGVSLILAGFAARLQRDGHTGAPEVRTAAEHVRTAIQKTRQLAGTVRPMLPRAAPQRRSH
jgi:signal transduction histidine kinase